MKAAVTIAAAELRQHRIVIWAGLLLGLLPLLLHYAHYGVPIPPFEPGQRQSDADGMLWATAILLSLAIALGVGSGVVSRDLSERRLGFYLARPLPLFQYWAGKIGTAFLLAVLAGLLALLPAHLLGSMRWTETADTLAHGGRVWLGAIGLAVAASSAAGGAVRARSGLLILDIVMLPLLGAGTWFALGRAWAAGTDEVLVLFGLRWIFAAAILVLLAAGFAQICVGRLELRRGHAILSGIAWGGLWLFFVGGILATNGYVARATPADVRVPYLSLFAPASGSHVMIDSISAPWSYHYHPGFLLDAQGGFVRLGGLDGLNGFAWSRDGRTFAWSREAPFRDPDIPTGGQPPFARGPGFEPSLRVQRLDHGGTPARTFLREEVGDAVRAISPSGRHLLVESRTRKQVVDAESGRATADVEDAEHWAFAAFLSETSVRGLRMQGVSASGATLGSSRGPASLRGQAAVVDWDLASGRLTERGTIALQGERAWFARLTPVDDWQRVLRFDATGLFLHELDGTLAATLIAGWTSRINRVAGSLSGGRYGCIEEERGGLRLRVFGPDGKTRMEVRFRGRFPLRVGGESKPGVLALGVAPGTEESQRATVFVDLTTGTVTHREPGLSPALRLWESGKEIDTGDPEPGSLATRLFLADEGLLSRDPATGTRTLLVARNDRLQD